MEDKEVIEDNMIVGRVFGWILIVVGSIYPLLSLVNLLVGGSFYNFSKGLLITSLALFFVGGILEHECKKRLKSK